MKMGATGARACGGGLSFFMLTAHCLLYLGDASSLSQHIHFGVHQIGNLAMSMAFPGYVASRLFAFGIIFISWFLFVREK